MKHARQQVLDYLQELVSTATGIKATTNRIGPSQQSDDVTIDVRATDEVLSTGDEDFEQVMSHRGVVAKKVVGEIEVMVMAPAGTSNTKANDLAADIENAIAANSGEHDVNGAWIDIQYVGMSYQSDPEGENPQAVMNILFTINYRSEIADARVLV